LLIHIFFEQAIELVVIYSDTNIDIFAGLPARNCAGEDEQPDDTKKNK